MHKIVLKDGTEYEILEGGSISHINMEVEEFSKIEEISNKFTKENLKEVKFKINDNVIGEYKNLILENILFISRVINLDNEINEAEISNGEDSSKSTDTNSTPSTKLIYVATISLRESTELELRLLALEDKIDNLNIDQEVTSDTINEILTDIIPSLIVGTNE